MSTVAMTILFLTLCNPLWQIHCGAKNCTLFIFYFDNFWHMIPEWICNKTVTKLSTSPNECHYTTLWHRTCVSLFITTVMKALNVMTNWQLWANASPQMFKVFASGFYTHIKTISPLINCLINDAVFDTVNSCTWRFFRHFSWMYLWCVPLISSKCQSPWRSDW